MASKSIPTILVLLVICGVLPPSAISKRVPRVVDALNVILRLIFSITYFFTELWIPSKVVKYLSSTHSVVVVLIRITFVVYHLLVMLTMSSALGKIFPFVSNLRLHSSLPLLPGFAYALVITIYVLIWRNPFSSLHRLPGLSYYFGYISCVLAITLQTVLIEIYRQELVKLNRQLEASSKGHPDLEVKLARVARRRARLNILVAEVEAGLGPVVAASVVTLCLRLSFSVFTNFTMVAKMFSGEHPDPFLYLFYPRSFFKGITLLGLAHAGQRLKDEANRGEFLVDALATSDRNFLPSTLNFQIQKCHLVFRKEKITVEAWGFFNLDHTLIILMVSIVFGLVMIQVQFQVSEVVSTTA